MKKQVNVQLDSSDREVLEALAFLRGELLSDVARGVLLEFIGAERNSPRVKAVLAEREAERLEIAKATKVTSLEGRRSHKKGS